MGKSQYALSTFGTRNIIFVPKNGQFLSTETKLNTLLRRHVVGKIKIAINLKIFLSPIGGDYIGICNSNRKLYS